LYGKRSHGGLDLIFACQGQKEKQKLVLSGLSNIAESENKKFGDVIKRKDGFT
jgi:hypothetical protein